MNAEIISSGTEILQGRYADTNAQFLSQQLTRHGVRVDWHTATSDDGALLRDTLQLAAQRADLAIMTGGLGPTEDDLTRQLLAGLTADVLVEDPRVVEMIEARFRRRKIPMNPSNRGQSLVPRRATVLYNEWGTAPGLMIEMAREGRTPFVLFALPGPPREMKPMFEARVIPLLEGKLGLRPAAKILDMHTIFRAESELNERIRDLFTADPRVTVALLANIGQVDIRLSCLEPDDLEREGLIEKFRREIVDRLGGRDIYGCDGETLESALGGLLAARGATIALAESCTGGWAAKRLTDVSGSSAYFLEGFVTYTNESKTARLGVPAELIAEHGAVSEPVARAMAEGVRRVTGATIGAGVTGVAGPTGGTPAKPVGMVCVAVATPDGTRANTTVYMGDRENVRNQSTNRLFDLTRRWLLETADARI